MDVILSHSYKNFALATWQGCHESQFAYCKLQLLIVHGSTISSAPITYYLSDDPLSYILYRMNGIPIVYENNDILVINKPAGLAVQGGKGISSSVDTLLPEQLGYKVYLVHRLDRDTAGLLVVAKTSASAAMWTKLIAGKQVQKEYYAICLGEFTSLKGTIAEAVMHKGSAKSALTYFSVEKSCEITLDDTEQSATNTIRLSLVRLILGTGRMHQLRIHLASQGTPIAGDDKYGDFKLNKVIRKSCGMKKLHLASVRLSLPLNTAHNITPRDSHKISNSMSGECKFSIFEINFPEHMKKTLALFP